MRSAGARAAAGTEWHKWRRLQRDESAHEGKSEKCLEAPKRGLGWGRGAGGARHRLQVVCSLSRSLRATSRDCTGLAQRWEVRHRTGQLGEPEAPPASDWVVEGPRARDRCLSVPWSCVLRVPARRAPPVPGSGSGGKSPPSVRNSPPASRAQQGVVLHPTGDEARGLSVECLRTFHDWRRCRGLNKTKRHRRGTPGVSAGADRKQAADPTAWFHVQGGRDVTRRVSC